jgi:hypothetical protein
MAGCGTGDPRTRLVSWPAWSLGDATPPSGVRSTLADRCSRLRARVRWELGRGAMKGRSMHSQTMARRQAEAGRLDGPLYLDDACEFSPDDMTGVGAMRRWPKSYQETARWHAEAAELLAGLLHPHEAINGRPHTHCSLRITIVTRKGLGVGGGGRETGMPKWRKRPMSKLDAIRAMTIGDGRRRAATWRCLDFVVEGVESDGAKPLPARRPDRLRTRRRLAGPADCRHLRPRSRSGRTADQGIPHAGHISRSQKVL